MAYTAGNRLPIIEIGKQPFPRIRPDDAQESLGLPALDALHAELLEADKQRDLAGLMALSEAAMQAGDQQLADEFQQHLVVERNHRMSDRMQVYLRQGEVFIAVGALHLPGEEGLLSLLEQQGFTVRRLY